MQSERKLVLAITEGDDATAQIARAVGRSGVDVVNHDVTAPLEGALSAARMGPHVIVAELGKHRDELGRVLDAIRRSSGFIPVLLLHRTVGGGHRATHTFGDAHLVEPFSLEQIHANVEVLLHPEVGPTERVIRVGDIEVNPAYREVLHNRSAVHFTRVEFDLLHFLVRNPGTVMSRSEILDHVWPQPNERTDNILDVYIAQIRKKTGHSRSPIIHTVRGVGFLVKARN